ncbi:MAG: serine/threonine protein kinase [Labilithrix sp.]|nr:serine/threonine protein kinase [Labilithrix sp.]
MTMGIGAHPALQGFQVLQELSTERGNKVFLARSKSGSVVAIKVLASQAISDEASSALSKEASLGARLTHEAILQTRSMVIEKDFAAVVTEFVPGISLQRLLRFATGRGVRLPDVCAWYILERVLAALASAHSQKDGAGGSQPVLHRGVSPSSVVVGWDGTVKIGDFGLVRMRQIVSSTSPSSGAATTDKDLPAMMAPEETRGDKPDARGDVFCAALLAVRLATGRTPYARFRKTRSEMTLAMAEGNVAHLAQTRPDLPEALRSALDAALEPDRDKRTTTAEELLAALRESTDVARGKAALAKLVGRWREALETSVTPWERRASIPDDVPEEETGLMKAGTLALATADERPSDAALVSAAEQPDEPWKKDQVPAEEAALAPTDPTASLSRVGSIAPDALIMPLPAMRITMPELPTYGGPAVNVSLPPPKRGVFTGGVAAAVVATMFIVLLGGAYMLFRWLLGG